MNRLSRRLIHILKYKFFILLLILLNQYSILYSQSTEVFIATEYTDFTSLDMIDDMRFVGSYQTRESLVSTSFWNSFDNIREEVDGVFFTIFIYNSSTKAWLLREVESPMLNVITLGDIIVDHYSQSLIIPSFTYNEDTLESQIFLRFDFYLNPLDTLNFNTSNTTIHISSQNPSTGEFIGGLRNSDWIQHPLIIPNTLGAYSVNDTFNMNWFPFHQFYFNPMTDGYILSDTYGGKIFFNSDLEITLECSASQFLDGGSNNTVVFNSSDSMSFTAGHSRYYIDSLSAFTDVEVIYRSHLGNCSYDTLYSYTPPELATISSTEYGFDAIYPSYIYNSVYYKSESNCTLLEVNNCTSYFSLTSINSSGNLNWRKFIGGDAYYRPQRTIATADSGVLMILHTYSVINNNDEFDTHYIKFDKYGNQELDFFSPFLSTSVSDIPIMNALVYPNPTSDYLYIQSGRPSMSSQLKIIDMSGRVMRCDEIDMSAKIDLRELSSGAYIFLLEDDQGELSSGKFIKE